MERGERGYWEATIQDAGYSKGEITKGLRKWLQKIKTVFWARGIPLFLVALLLGRALILSQLTPFVLPFFAVVYIIERDRAPLVLFGLLLGSVSLSFQQAVYSFILCLFFIVFYKVASMFLDNPSLKAAPYVVLFVSLISKCMFLFFLHNFTLTPFDGMMAAVEASLSFVLVFIFIHSIPLLSIQKRKRTLKTEEIICFVILLASVMTGTIGWTLYDLSIEHILSRYLVIVFAFIAGAAVGSTVGVVTGLIFSLASVTSLQQMSLLAFAGLLGGLLREGKQLGTGFGLMVATLLMGLYGETNSPLLKTVYESAIAISLLLITPRQWMKMLAKHIPGTQEYVQDQQKYARKIRDITVRRVEQFSSVFQALSKSFSQSNQLTDVREDDKEFDYFLSNVTAKTCQSCYKKAYCWGAEQFNTTYDLMKKIMHEMDESSGTVPMNLYHTLSKHCHRKDKVLQAVHQELNIYQANLKLKKQIQESRKLVAEQLLGVSKVMGDFAREIQREQENHHKQEEMILEALQDFGIEIEEVEIYNLTPGNIDIDITLPNRHLMGECEKIIAPLLSDLLDETIIVQSEDFSKGASDYHYATFRSAKTYTIETGVAHAAKGGGFLSGDSYAMMELGPGNYAVAISDGMGNGERAYHESSETLHLLQKILKSGIEETIAIKSVNSVLSLRSTDEIFSTLDLAMIDLQSGQAKFLKVGSTPSFIKRGNKIIKIEAANLPMGILQEFDVDVVTEQLRAGDLLIMMSDGIYEGPNHVENYDIWMTRKLRELETDDPQAVADLIMEEVIRSSSGVIYDDMTCVVVKMKHNTPKWASIPVKNKLLKIS